MVIVAFLTVTQFNAEVRATTTGLVRKPDIVSVDRDTTDVTARSVCMSPMHTTGAESRFR